MTARLVALFCLVALLAHTLSGCGQAHVESSTAYPKLVQTPTGSFHEVCYEGVVYISTSVGLTVKFVVIPPRGGITAVPAQCPQEQAK